MGGGGGGEGTTFINLCCKGVFHWMLSWSARGIGYMAGTLLLLSISSRVGLSFLGLGSNIRPHGLAVTI